MPSADSPKKPGRRHADRWDVFDKVLGVVLGTILVCAGLAFVGFMVFVIVGMNSFGSNK
jgi:hypothetical protein